MLRSEELMAGDWVYMKAHRGFDSQYIKVESIPDPSSDAHYGHIGAYPISEDMDFRDIEDSHLEPIPITPEILEKNGFKKLDDGIWPRYVFIADIQKWPQTIIEFTFYGEGVLVETLFKCWTKPECGDGENSIHICDLKYVHQMQHALRLCGIDKTIEL